MTLSQAGENEQAGAELFEIMSSRAGSLDYDPSPLLMKEGGGALTLSSWDYDLIPRHLHAGIRKANERPGSLPSSPARIGDFDDLALSEGELDDGAVTAASTESPS